MAASSRLFPERLEWTSPKPGLEAHLPAKMPALRPDVRPLFTLSVLALQIKAHKEEQFVSILE
jgi:hypothetical protein